MMPLSLLQELCSPLTQGLYLLDPPLVSLFHCPVCFCVVAPRKYHNWYSVRDYLRLSCVSFICCTHIPLLRLVHSVSCLLWLVNQCHRRKWTSLYGSKCLWLNLERVLWLRGSLGPFPPQCYKLEVTSTFFLGPQELRQPSMLQAAGMGLAATSSPP